MARAQGARAQMALGFESIYGMPPAANSFWKIPFASSSLGSEQPLLGSELLGYGRDPLAPVKDAITADGDVVVPIDARAFGIWLKGAFGAPITTTVKATGSIVFAVNPSAGDTITLNGSVWTFVTGVPAGSETQIGLTLAATLTQLVTDLNASADTEIAKCTYGEADGTTLTIEFDTAGTTGNDFTLAASAAMPSASSLGGGGFSHEFQSGNWTLPSMSIETGMPDVPRFAMYSGCVVDQMSWTMQRSGLLTASVSVVAQQEVNATVSVAGTLEALDLLRFGHFNGAIRRNDVDLCSVVSTQISYSNNLDRIETICDGGKIGGADPSIAALTGSMVVRFADTTLLDQAVEGEPCELEFSYTLVSGEKLTITAHAVYLPKPRISIEGPGGVQATFAWQAARDELLGRMCTITLVNDMPNFDNPA